MTERRELPKKLRGRAPVEATKPTPRVAEKCVEREIRLVKRLTGSYRGIRA